ncbi:MAG: type II toxin-antitoxin system RelE/ParE family toxin [Candidatus Sulfotelmatobacter sp.]
MRGAKEYRLHPLAWQEVEEADSWYLSHSYHVSVEFLSVLYAAVEDISLAPQRWPEYLYGTRRLVIRRFPFSIVYLHDPNSSLSWRLRTVKAEAGILEGSAVSTVVVTLPTSRKGREKWGTQMWTICYQNSGFPLGKNWSAGLESLYVSRS